MRPKPEQVLADSGYLFQEESAFATPFCEPPAPGSGAYKEAAALLKRIKALTPAPKGYPLDPFGSLDRALRELTRGSSRRPTLQSSSDQLNAHDPISKARVLMWEIAASIEGCKPPSLIDAVAYSLAEDSVLGDHSAEQKMLAYRVDTSAIETAVAELHAIALQNRVSDIRCDVVMACFSLIHAHLYHVRQHIFCGGTGEVLEFVFREGATEYWYKSTSG